MRSDCAEYGHRLSERVAACVCIGLSIPCTCIIRANRVCLVSCCVQLSKSADSISRRLPTLENALPEPTFTAADATTGTTNAADTQVTQLAQRTAASLTSRADEVLAWSNMEALSEASPVVSAAFRSVSGWLRSAGVALGETAQRVAVELGEKRGQRHMLYDEIHALREEVSGRVWWLWVW